MKKLWVVAGISVVTIGIAWYLMGREKVETFSAKDFEMVSVKKGSVAHVVTASGKIQPINKVSVGTQVSGIIEQVLVDYNDEVKEGQVLARLDTSVLQENLNDAKARYDLAVAKKKISDLNYERLSKLYKEKLISKANLEEAEIDLETAKANVLSSQAEYNKSERNFGYATITSPVSGTVISKEVEQGQTVAASLSTPTLFMIAEDFLAISSLPTKSLMFCVITICIPLYLRIRLASWNIKSSATGNLVSMKTCASSITTTILRLRPYFVL